MHRCSECAEYDFSGLKPYAPPPDAPLVVMADLDGTMCLANGRHPIRQEHLAGQDLPNRPVVKAVRALADAGHPVIFMSGRTDACREISEEWLDRCFTRPFEALHMRARGDNRKDYIVKAELFDKHVRHRFDVLTVFDDRNQVVCMWRHLGLTVFQVAEGRF